MKKKICGQLGGMVIITSVTLPLIGQPILGNLQTKKGKIKRLLVMSILQSTFLVLKFWQKAKYNIQPRNGVSRQTQFLQAGHFETSFHMKKKRWQTRIQLEIWL
jgi:hypothetical protein